jgi:hypothetical protein
MIFFKEFKYFGIFYANIPEYPVNFPSPGGLVRLQRKGVKGRGL